MGSRKIIIFFLTVCLSCSTYQLDALNETDHKLLKARSLYTVNCTNDDECIVNSYCYYGRCTCKSGFLADKDYRKGPVKCIKEATDIDDYCEKDIQCMAAFGNHAICRKLDSTNIVGKCDCNDDSHFIDNLCYPNAYIGQPCEVSDNCYIRNKNIKSYCEYGHCTCPPNYHSIDNGKDCIPTSVLFGPCLTSESCITMYSDCQNGFCSCRNDFITNFDNTSCIQVAKEVGDACSEDKQCTFYIQNSRCETNDSICLCHEGYHSADGYCWLSKTFLDHCNHTNECRPNTSLHKGLHCFNDICQCMPGYALDKGMFCIENVNERSNNRGTPNTVSAYILSGVIFISFFVV